MKARELMVCIATFFTTWRSTTHFCKNCCMAIWKAELWKAFASNPSKSVRITDRTTVTMLRFVERSASPKRHTTASWTMARKLSIYLNTLPSELFDKMDRVCQILEKVRFCDMVLTARSSIFTLSSPFAIRIGVSTFCSLASKFGCTLDSFPTGDAALDVVRIQRPSGTVCYGLLSAVTTSPCSRRLEYIFRNLTKWKGK